MPITLFGLALIGRKRFGPGLALLVATAFTRETFPFCIVGVGWAGHLGAKRSAVAAGTVIGLAFAGGLDRLSVDGSLLGTSGTC